MSDWAVGDRALCVKSGEKTSEGRIYTVAQIIPPGSFCDGIYNHHPVTGLRFVEVAHSYRAASDERRFRKIRPDEHQSCEPEFVTLLENFKRKVSA
jgi:hypothetical protein